MNGLFRTVSNKIIEGYKIQSSNGRALHSSIHLSTRAVHLKIARDLSADSFILSLRQFLSRRGTIRVLRSYGGANFVGVSAELKQSIKALDRASINKHLVAKNIDLKFNPPVMGGTTQINKTLFKSHY